MVFDDESDGRRNLTSTMSGEIAPKLREATSITSGNKRLPQGAEKSLWGLLLVEAGQEFVRVR